MTGAKGPVYVVGAAGHQGGAALQHLRALGIEAHALFGARDVRRNHDPRWAEPGTGTAQFDRPDTLAETLRGASALILILEDPDTGPAERLRHGQNLVDASAQAGVGHVVFAAATGPDHHRLSCDVSSEIARYVEQSGVPATILRPATFMEEVPWYWLNRYGRELVLTTPFVPVGSSADGRPGRHGRARRAGGDAVRTSSSGARSMWPETRARHSTSPGCSAPASREPVRYEEVQVEGVFVYQEASTQVHDVGRLRELYPRLHTFESWLESGGLALCREEVGPGPARGVRQAA